MRNQPSPQTDRWKRLSSFLPLDRFDPIAALLYLREHTTQREQIENVSVHRRADLQGFEPVNLAIFTALPGRRGIAGEEACRMRRVTLWACGWSLKAKPKT